MTKTLTVGAFIGLALGTFATTLILVVSSILAFAQKTRIEIPGVYSVWPDGSAGLAFIPNFLGIALTVCAITAVCVGVSAFARLRAVAQ